MTVKINKRLNLVLTVEMEDGRTVKVHSIPISAEVFEKYFLSLSKTYASMIENGGEWMVRSGPRTAKMMLKRVAEASGAWDAPDGVKNGLLAEMRRLTTVLQPGPNGWEMVTYQEAVDRSFFSEEDVSEIENSLTFFTACSVSMRRSEANELLATVYGLLGSETTFSNAIEFMTSLTT